MYERLVENWLTSVNEIGYQVPFCEVLVAEGYTILHMSRHGRGEHGKDIVARRGDGVLCTFQLKGGDINLTALREIRGEVEELVQLPVRLPGVSEAERHVPHLVTNGELRGDAPESLTRYRDEWVRKGHEELQVWERGTLLTKFLQAQGTFLPTALPGFREFVDLYAGPFGGPFPREKFATFFEPLIEAATTGATDLKLRRSLAAGGVVASYIIEQYSRAGNHLAAAVGWVMVGANVMRAAEKSGADAKVYAPVLEMAWAGFDRSLDALVSEVLSSDNLVCPKYVVVDSMVYGIRAAEVLGWLAAWVLEHQGRREEKLDKERVFVVLRRESPGASWVGEADWATRLAVVLFLDREERAAEARMLLESWISSVVSLATATLEEDSKANGVPSPYWLPEDVLRRRHGLLAPADDEFFGHSTFTAAQALDMLVRRMARESVATLWPPATRTIFNDFVPDSAGDVFTWRTRAGVLHETMPSRTRSWAAWSEEVATVSSNGLPGSLVRHPEWLLPFLLVYPHRANRQLTALADALIGRRAALSKA